MAIAKKIKLYELDPKFFKDGSGNGIGDLKGLTSKVDYFKFLGVDGIILQNVLSSESNDAVQNFTNVAKDLGTVNDLTTIISKAKTQGTKVFLEIGIGAVKETHRWFNNSATSVDEFEDVIDFKSQEADDDSEYKYSQDSKGYYSFDSSTQEVPLNWKSEKVLEQFMKVIRFWKDLGIAGFVFKGFEYLSNEDKSEMMSPETLKELRKFYRAIKEIDDNVIIIGKSSIVGIANTNQYTEGSTKVFDYFMTQQISLLGTSAKHGNDQIGSFKPSQLSSAIKKYVNDASNIVTFGSNLTGRVNARWGNAGQFSIESAKALGMLLSLTPGSSSIYYGDEIGMLNIGLTHLDNFQDATLVSRRKELETSGKVKEKDFMSAQVLQNPINSRSLMSWNPDKNGGFSNSEKTITPVNSTYKEINVANQFEDKSSTLLFFKELLRIIGSSSYAQIIEKGRFSISSFIPGVIKMTSKLGDKEIRTYVNLTNKNKKIIKAKEGKVVLSSYAHKTYKDIPSTLEAFEAIIISKNTDEAIKLTQQIKAIKAKEEKETQSLELKNKRETQKAEIQREKDLAKEAERKAKEDAKEAEREAKEKNRIAEEKVRAEEEAKAAKAAKTQELKAKKEVTKTQELKAKKEDTKTKEIKVDPIEDAAKEEVIDKVALKEAKQQEKTRAIELKQAKKEEAKVAKAEEKEELQKVKEAAKAEREAARILKKAEAKFSIMDEEVMEDEKTTLKEEDIAETTQIDVDDIDDFDAFLDNTKKNKK